MSRRYRTPGADERPTAEYLVVAAVLAVVLLAVGGAAAADMYLNRGGTLQAEVQAGASVASNETAGNVTVTWTSNQNADFLLVDFGQGGEAMRVADATGDANTTGERVVLTAVGESVTFTERQTATPTAGETATPRTVEVVVTAAYDENGDGTLDDADVRTVILVEEVEV